MFSKFTAALDGIGSKLEGITQALTVLSERPHDPPPYGDLPDRLSSLEGRLAGAIGEIDAGILKAESIKSAARSAEERARGHMKRGEAALEAIRSVEDGEETDPFEAAARAYADVGIPRNGETQQEGELPAVHRSLESRRESRALARSHKRR
jgi:hypothetical protein